MFFRVKPAGDRRYLQIVENRRDGAKTRQTVVATLGRLDELEASGKLDVLLRSGARLCETAMLVSSLRQGTLDAVSTRRIGAPLVFGATVGGDRLRGGDPGPDRPPGVPVSGRAGNLRYHPPSA